jgi:hypothetical protein
MKRGGNRREVEFGEGRGRDGPEKLNFGSGKYLNTYYVDVRLLFGASSNYTRLINIFCISIFFRTNYYRTCPKKATNLRPLRIDALEKEENGLIQGYQYSKRLRETIDWRKKKRKENIERKK